MDVWTRVSKPTESSIIATQMSAQPFGLLMAITSVLSTTSTSVISGWTDISKPTVSSWTSVAKPISSVWTFVAKPTQ